MPRAYFKVGRLRVTIGHLRVTIGYLKATVVNIRVTLGHLRASISHHRVTLGHLKDGAGHYRITIGILLFMKQRILQSEILEIRAYCQLKDTDKQEDIIPPSPVTTFTLPHALPIVIRQRIPQFDNSEVTCTSGAQVPQEKKPMYLQNLPLMSQILYFFMEFAYFVLSNIK